MRDSAKNTGRILHLVAALLLLMPEASFGVDRSLKERPQDSAKTRPSRMENFLLRAVEELDRSLTYEKAVIDKLEKQSDSAEQRYPDRRASDIKGLLGWHRAYANWLKERLSESESDLENFYTREMIRPALDKRYHALADDYGRLADQFGQQARQMDEAREINEATIQKLINIIEYYEYIIAENRKASDEKQKNEKNSEKNPFERKPPDDWKIYSKDLTDEKIMAMKLEINVRRDLRSHFDGMIDLGRHEMNWLSLKSDDSTALSGLARALTTDSAESIEAATDGMIKRYEADVAFFEKKLKEIDRKRTELSLGGTGTMTALDRREELADYYFTLKSRFEHHIQWLKEQIGAYRADIVQLSKEKKE